MPSAVRSLVDMPPMRVFAFAVAGLVVLAAVLTIGTRLIVGTGRPSLGTGIVVDSSHAPSATEAGHASMPGPSEGSQGPEKGSRATTDGGAAKAPGPDVGGADPFRGADRGDVRRGPPTLEPSDPAAHGDPGCGVPRPCMPWPSPGDTAPSRRTSLRRPRARPPSLAEVTERAELQTRIDRKYLVPVDAVADLVSGLGRFAVLEIDGLRGFRYESVYFDTPDLLTYRAHLHDARAGAGADHVLPADDAGRPRRGHPAHARR